MRNKQLRIKCLSWFCMTIVSGAFLSACVAVEYEKTANSTEVPITLNEVNVAVAPSTRLTLDGNGAATGSSFDTGDKMQLEVYDKGAVVLATEFTAAVANQTTTWQAAESCFWPKSVEGYEVSYVSADTRVTEINDGDLLPDVLSVYVPITEIPEGGAISVQLKHKMAQFLLNVSLAGGYYSINDILSGETPVVGEQSNKVALKGLHHIAKIYPNGTYEEDDAARDVHLKYKGKSGDLYQFYALVPADYELNQMRISVAGREYAFRVPQNETNLFETGTSYTYELNLEYYQPVVSAASVEGWKEGAETADCIEIAAWDGVIAKTFSGGNGLQETPFLIQTPQQLAYMAQCVNSGKQYKHNSVVYEYKTAHYKLMADLNLNNLPWAPIGANSTYLFEGVFEGNYHTIAGLKVCMTEADNVFGGLFGRVGAVTFSNLWLDGDVAVTSNLSQAHAGGLIGLLQAEHATITNCHFSGTVSATNIKSEGLAAAGGIVAYLSGQGTSSSTIQLTGCSSNGSVVASTTNGNAMVGGISGRTYLISLFGCKSTGMSLKAVSESGNMLMGGIVGSMAYSTLDGCVAVDNRIVCGDNVAKGVKACAGGLAGDALQTKVLAGLTYGGSLSALSATPDSCMTGGVVGHLMGASSKIANSLHRNTTLQVPDKGMYAGVSAFNRNGSVVASYSTYREASGAKPLTGSDYALLTHTITSTLNANITSNGSLYQWWFDGSYTQYMRYYPIAE